LHGFATSAVARTAIPAVEGEARVTGEDIFVQRCGNIYLVSDDVTLMYGFGDTIEEARADYEESVRELITILEHSPNPLDKPTLIAVRCHAKAHQILD
jgi:hypothetical protein